MDSPRYDWLRRAARTFLQAFVATLMTFGIGPAQEAIRALSSGDPYEFDFNFWQALIIAASLAGVVALVTALQNALEDKAGLPAVLKGKATSGQNPVPEPDAYDPMNPATWPSTPAGASEYGKR